MIRSGFFRTALPTACAARGWPIRRARSPYVTVFPKGIRLSSSQTFLWNAVPARCSFKPENPLPFPPKYSLSCRAQVRAQDGTVPEGTLFRTNAMRSMPDADPVICNGPRGVEIVTPSPYPSPTGRGKKE